MSGHGELYYHLDQANYTHSPSFSLFLWSNYAATGKKMLRVDGRLGQKPAYRRGLQNLFMASTNVIFRSWNLPLDLDNSFVRLISFVSGVL